MFLAMEEDDIADVVEVVEAVEVDGVVDVAIELEGLAVGVSNR